MPSAIDAAIFICCLRHTRQHRRATPITFRHAAAFFFRHADAMPIRRHDAVDADYCHAFDIFLLMIFFALISFSFLAAYFSMPPFRAISARFTLRCAILIYDDYFAMLMRRFRFHFD